MSGNVPEWLGSVEKFDSAEVSEAIKQLEHASGGVVDKITGPVVGMALRVISDAADNHAVPGQ